MSGRTRAADDFAEIRKRLDELKREPAPEQIKELPGVASTPKPKPKPLPPADEEFDWGLYYGRWGSK